MFRYHRMMVPLDGSELAEGALPLAQTLLPVDGSALAEDHATGLIALSSYGRTGWERWSFGSGAEKVVRTAPGQIEENGGEQE